MLYFIQSIDLLAAGEAFLHWFRISRPPDDTKIDAFFGGSGGDCYVSGNETKKTSTSF